MPNFGCQEQANLARRCTVRVKLCAEPALTTSRERLQMLRARRARVFVRSTESHNQYREALSSSCTRNLHCGAQDDSAAKKHTGRQVSTFDGYWDRSQAPGAAQQVNSSDRLWPKGVRVDCRHGSVFSWTENGPGKRAAAVAIPPDPRCIACGSAVLFESSDCCNCKRTCRGFAAQQRHCQHSDRLRR